MSNASGMFLFEVVVANVNTMVESRFLLIKSDFADVFSLELKDPKQMYIVMPEAPPPPPEPPGKKKKKKKPPKKKKGKKGAAEPPPPPEPVIQAGQSVLFPSSAEVLLQNMLDWPLEVSLWSKEEHLTFIGSVSIPWDPIFHTYLKTIAGCGEAPPVILKDDYNIFEEGKAKIMAKLGLQVKLTYLKNKVTSSFRTLSEDPTVKRYLYTGMNSKTTSYICTMKTTDEVFEENSNKVPNEYLVDRETAKPKEVNYASFKNAPGANLTFFKEGEYCCTNTADKPPDNIYTAPETCPDIDKIVDYVRKIIVSCNDNMRMLTPRPTIRPRVKATDIDRLCYCRETQWPPGEFAELFKRRAQSEPCPLCVDAGEKPEGARGATFDIANIRGPCGRPECRIARDIRAFIENLVEEDNKELILDDIVGPCGTKKCTVVQKIQEVIRHEGAFAEMETLPGLSTQCACLEKMQQELIKGREVCSDECENDCEDSSDSSDNCEGPSCPYRTDKTNRVYNVYYFTVEHDLEMGCTPSPSIKSAGSAKKSPSNTSKKSNRSESSGNEKFPYCPPTCPTVKLNEDASCSKPLCALGWDKVTDSKCTTPVCSSKFTEPSPADSQIVMNFNEIYNPCCVKSCDMAETVKEFISGNAEKAKNRLKCKERALDDTDPCYCDCVCTFKFSNKTTYCPVCGGYECLGDDTKDLPSYAKPHPCPIYHKMYDKKVIQVKSPWPEENVPVEREQSPTKTTKAVKTTEGTPAEEKEISPEKAPQVATKKLPTAAAPKAVDELSAQVNVNEPPPKKKDKYQYPPVPKNMGWNWVADDIPGMKPRPKWRPGCVHKMLHRKYRAAKDGTENIAKKKRAMMQRKKKIEMKPTLVVSKRDGEYTVQMEVFKKYSKERLVYQYPYDEKQPLIYTVGKTEAEKAKIQVQRDRRERREMRRKNRLLQSTFRDRCQEICLKAYNQAIGLLPLPTANNPNCPCDTTDPPEMETIIDSCSCSDEGATISSSDTDNDEWTIEFTPPLARWDPKAKHTIVVAENECQYNYLDFKVKLLDKSGNPVPRFFKSHEGKQECSDLGGFWGPGKVWLEINKDGYIGPDGRWIPMNFLGPDGMYYSAEEGSFTDANGNLLTVGVDGYVDQDLKWVWYPNKKRTAKSSKPSSPQGGTPKERGKGSPTRKPGKEGTCPCAQPEGKKKGTEKGSGEKKGTEKGTEKGSGEKKGTEKGSGEKKGTEKGSGDKTKAKAPSKPRKSKGGQEFTVATVSSVKPKPKKTKVKSMTVSNTRDGTYSPTNLRHSNRPYTDQKKLSVYKEIMEGLQNYSDLGYIGGKQPNTTNRACNTYRKNKNKKPLK